MSRYGAWSDRKVRLPPWFSILLLSFLVSPIGLLAQSRPHPRAEAVERALSAVEQQHYEDALEIFQTLAAQNPADLEARIWVARLESWRGNQERAEELYEKVLADDPDNVEAGLGRADVLAWQGRYQEALEQLGVLRERQPANLEVLLRLAKVSRWQRRRRQALQYYQEVLALDPVNTEAREAVDILSAEKPFRLESGYFFEEFNFTSNTHGQFVELLYRDYHRLTLLARFHYQNKFDQDNTRFTVGTTYRFWTRTWVRGEFSWAPAGDTVIANQDYTVELTQGVHPLVAVGGSYRFLSFREAQVQVLTALLNWDPRSDLHFYLRYTPARTRFDLSGRSLWNHGGWARLVWDANRAFSPYILFAVGAENFADISAEQLGRFSARTYGGGTELRLRRNQGFRVGYYYQRRSQGRREQNFGVSYFVDF